MTIDQIRAALEKRANRYEAESKLLQGGFNPYKAGKAKATRDDLSLLELFDGQEGSCPRCGSSMGSRLPDGRWRCAGLSSYAVLPSEYCGCVYQDNQGTPR